MPVGWIYTGSAPAQGSSDIRRHKVNPRISLKGDQGEGKGVVGKGEGEGGKLHASHHARPWVCSAATTKLTAIFIQKERIILQNVALFHRAISM